MSVMSVRIKDEKKHILKVIASIEGKTMGGLISELIDGYILKNRNRLKLTSEEIDLKELMSLSNNSFMEWDNDEDEVYNDL